jgi:isoquinoline 1-oxidoreductase beta subunit
MSAVADEFASSRGLSRREFLRRLQAMGGLLLVADGLQIAKAAAAPKYGAAGMPHGTVDSPLVFLTVGDDGWVTIVVHRSEMGQGVRTGMPLIVADELEADWPIKRNTATKTRTGRAAPGISLTRCVAAAPRLE